LQTKETTESFTPFRFFPAEMCYCYPIHNYVIKDSPQSRKKKAKGKGKAKGTGQLRRTKKGGKTVWHFVDEEGDGFYSANVS
jgi:hypothetical protein